METLVPDIRVRLFELATAAGRIACCSVSHAWNKYAMHASLILSKHPHLFFGIPLDKSDGTPVSADPADFTADELAAMFADYHLLSRCKPQFHIGTYTVCAGGDVQAATLVLLRNGSLKMLNTGVSADTSQQLVLDPIDFSDAINGAMRSGSAEMIQFVMMLVPVNDPAFETICQNVRYNADDAVLGGRYSIDWMLSMREPGTDTYTDLFVSACAYSDLDTIAYVRDLCITASEQFANDSVPVNVGYMDGWNNHNEYPEHYAEVNHGAYFRDDAPVIPINDASVDLTHKKVSPCGELFEGRWGIPTLSVPKQPEIIPMVSADTLLGAVNLNESALLTAQSVAKDMLHYQVRKNYRCRGGAGKLNLHTIFSHGVVAAVKQRRIDVMKIVSSYTDEHRDGADPQAYQQISISLAQFIGELDDVDFLEELLAADNKTHVALFSMLLLLVSVDCPRIVKYMLARVAACPRTSEVFNLMNQHMPVRSDDYIDMLLMTIASYGRTKTFEVVIAEHPPTIRQLNKYMAMACNNTGPNTAYKYKKYGAVMCGCGSTHALSPVEGCMF